ncbi:MAG: SpoIIE family protein phosphatase [Deltaproteobacteria bacterium]|nr:SpoIIE family protein phosphatase [Deltaproteobacteria bacterium]
MNTVICGVSQRSCKGELICGDVIRTFERAALYVIAIADGLGHGRHANLAATAFCDAVEQAADISQLEQVIHSANRNLSSTRGAAVALVVIDRDKSLLHFVGIGNIALQSISQYAIRPISIAGILGRRVRTVKVFSCNIASNDIIAIYSDGISSRFSLSTCIKEISSSLGVKATPQEIADKIVSKHGKDIDDASCIVLAIT